ncbi:hypothetical protein [Janthinobacterium sp. J1-1]|uniref:hypothetical protein n=1 Tax=Janthinobacterium sp. J1-1 TaxID=3065910 RepID=UPI0028119DBB|nr:hypothetical protein [Janthinobacterium sp. J1-1]
MIMHNVRIAAIAYHLPVATLDNSVLAQIFPDWPAQKIVDKTCITQRHISAPDETAGDLEFALPLLFF